MHELREVLEDIRAELDNIGSQLSDIVESLRIMARRDDADLLRAQ